jgi:hypothetical protein
VTSIKIITHIFFFNFFNFTHPLSMSYRGILSYHGPMVVLLYMFYFCFFLPLGSHFVSLPLQKVPTPVPTSRPTSQPTPNPTSPSPTSQPTPQPTVRQLFPWNICRDGGSLTNPNGVLVSFLGVPVLCGTAQFVGGVFGVGFTFEQCAIAQGTYVRTYV